LLLLQLEILQDSAEIRLEISAVKRQFVDIIGGLATQTATAAGRSDAASTSSTFSRRRRRQHSTSPSSPKPKRLSDGHLATSSTMRRSCAAAVLACSARTRGPTPASADSAETDHDDDARRRPRPAQRPTLGTRRLRLSDNKENIERHPSGGKLPFSCRPRYRRLFPDLNEDDELERSSSLVRTSSAVREEPDCRGSSTTMRLEDVSAISRTSSDGEGGAVLRRVRSTASVSSLNGAFCSSSTGDVEEDPAGAAGAFCSTFSYPLHSTVVDSFFDVSALLPPRSPPHHGHSPPRSDQHADGSSRNSGVARGCEDAPPARSLKDADRQLLGNVLSGCQLAGAVDGNSRRSSATVEQLRGGYQFTCADAADRRRPYDELSPPSATGLDLARTGDGNCTARLRRQMGQTRLHTTNNSQSSSQRQSDLASCSRLDDASRSTLFECECAAERRRFRRPVADEYGAVPTSSNFSLSRCCRRYAETTVCFTDTCRSWSSDRRRMTMHCPPAAASDALFSTGCVINETTQLAC